MRLLVIGALLATLVGCCRAPPQASLERCTSKGCIHKTAANPPVELKPVSFRPGPATSKREIHNDCEDGRASINSTHRAHRRRRKRKLSDQVNARGSCARSCG